MTPLAVLALAAVILYTNFNPPPAPGPGPVAYQFRPAGKLYAADGARAFSKALREAATAATAPAADLAKVKKDLQTRHNALRSAAFDARFLDPLNEILPPAATSDPAAVPPYGKAQITAWAKALSDIADGLDDGATAIDGAKK